MNDVMMELERCAKEWNCSLAEAAMEGLSIHFEAAGFQRDILAEELSAMTDDELIRLCLEL